MQRRHLLAAALAAPSVARAQGTGVTFDRPLRIIVPNAPGGTSDILARLISVPLGKAVGQSVIVENRTGAGGNIGADYVAKSAPDGTAMLLLDVSVLATNPFLFSRLPFDVEKDLATVTMLIYAPYIIAARNGLPVRDAAGLAAYVKANPGKLNFGNAGAGTLTHLVSVALATVLGRRDHAGALSRRRPGAAGGDQRRGRRDHGRRDPVDALVTQGQMRGIAVSGPHRLATLPDLPTFAELGWPHPNAGTWQGVLVQGNTPPAVVARLEEALRQVMQEPAVRQRVAELGGEPRTDGAKAFREQLRADTASLGKVIRDHNITLDQ